MALGTSSPKTIVNSATRAVTTSSAMTPAWRREDGIAAKQALEVGDDAGAGERRGEEADERDADLDRRPGSGRAELTSRLTRRAPRLPSSTSCSIRVRRTRTSEYSAATNRPLSRMSRAMMRISTAIGYSVSSVARLRSALADARRHADGQLARRHVLGDHRAGAGVGALADRQRRAQDGVRADERAVADDRLVLAPPVVVGGDGARRRCSRPRRSRRRPGS